MGEQIINPFEEKASGRGRKFKVSLGEVTPVHDQALGSAVEVVEGEADPAVTMGESNGRLRITAKDVLRSITPAPADRQGGANTQHGDPKKIRHRSKERLN